MEQLLKILEDNARLPIEDMPKDGETRNRQ